MRRSSVSPGVPPRGIALLLLAAAMLLLGNGCAVNRRLTIRSDPPGARVRLDDKSLGTTPVTASFQHYGTRRVTLYKDGYLTHTEQIKLRAPWYARFPLDLVTEVFWPFGYNDLRTYQVTLVPGEEVRDIPSLRSVIDRANTLRQAGPEGPRHLPEPQPREVPRDDEP